MIFFRKYRAIFDKIYRFARAMKSSRGLVCACADTIARDRSRETKRPLVYDFKSLKNNLFKV